MTLQSLPAIVLCSRVGSFLTILCSVCIEGCAALRPDVDRCRNVARSVMRQHPKHASLASAGSAAPRHAVPVSISGGFLHVEQRARSARRNGSAFGRLLTGSQCR